MEAWYHRDISHLLFVMSVLVFLSSHNIAVCRYALQFLCDIARCACCAAARKGIRQLEEDRLEVNDQHCKVTSIVRQSFHDSFR